MIKKIPFIVCLTYCVAMEELLGKVPVLPAFLLPWGLAVYAVPQLGYAQEADNFFSIVSQFSECFITSPVSVPSSCVRQHT